MIGDMVARVFSIMNDWHEEGLTAFSVPLADFPESSIALAHCNYCTWHIIAARMDAELERYQNRRRNQLIQQLDDEFLKLQKGVGPYNSETLGSIVDRLIVLHLKRLHAIGDEAKAKVLFERHRLLDCAIELFYQTLRGERQCFRCDRSKIDYEGKI